MFIILEHYYKLSQPQNKYLSMDTRQKKHVLTGCCQTFKVWQPLKQTVTPKASCLYVFDQCILLIFHFSQLPGTFLAQKKHTCFWKLFLTSKHSCKEYFVERKQMNSTTTACSKLWMLGSKTCHVCTQLELQFIPHLFRLRCNQWYVWGLWATTKFG